MRATDGGFQAAWRRVSLGFSVSGIANRGRPARPAARHGGPSPIGTARARNRRIPGHGRARPDEIGRRRKPPWFGIEGASVEHGRRGGPRSGDRGSPFGG